jgi:hypothetical protein
MSQPFSGIPDPGAPRPFKRRQAGVVQEWIRDALPKAQRYSQDLWLRGKRYSQNLWLRGKRSGENLWQRGKRNPRPFAMGGAAVVLVAVGAYALMAVGPGHSLCPAAGEQAQKAPFVLLMDPVPHPAARSELEIHYDICGLPSRTPYRGQVRLSPQVVSKKKKGSPKLKPMVITFHDQVDGLATRRSQQVALGSTKPGAYTLELSVTDNQGRARKRVQRVWVKAR